MCCLTSCWNCCDILPARGATETGTMLIKGAEEVTVAAGSGRVDMVMWGSCCNSC